MFCFAGCRSLSTVTFESDSKLSRIEKRIFGGCQSLSSVYCPRSLHPVLHDYRGFLRSPPACQCA
jgi:hypothetical protein